MPITATINEVGSGWNLQNLGLLDYPKIIINNEAVNSILYYFPEVIRDENENGFGFGVNVSSTLGDVHLVRLDNNDIPTEVVVWREGK